MSAPQRAERCGHGRVQDAKSHPKAVPTWELRWSGQPGGGGRPAPGAEAAAVSRPSTTPIQHVLPDSTYTEAHKTETTCHPTPKRMARHRQT